MSILATQAHTVRDDIALHYALLMVVYCLWLVRGPSVQCTLGGCSSDLIVVFSSFKQVAVSLFRASPSTMVK